MNRRHFLGMLGAGAAGALGRPAQGGERAGSRLAMAARRVADRVLTAEPARRYSYEIALQAILRFARGGGDASLGERVVTLCRSRGWEDAQKIWLLPFCNLPLELHRHTGASASREGFLREFAASRANLRVSPEGAYLHPRGRFGAGHAILIDGMQEYASRLAWQTQLQSGDDWAPAVRQFVLYRELLRDPATGLWSNGRGWLEEPARNSPHAWSRGHGWLTRGLLETLAAIPAARPEHGDLVIVLEEILLALLPCQRPDGLYPCLLDLPADASPREASGSALIAAAFAIAVSRGWVRRKHRERLAASARSTFARLPDCVTPGGEVNFVSPGPGPLQSAEAYRIRGDFGPDAHGDFALLSAAAAESELAAGSGTGR